MKFWSFLLKPKEQENWLPNYSQPLSFAIFSELQNAGTKRMAATNSKHLLCHIPNFGDQRKSSQALFHCELLGLFQPVVTYYKHGNISNELGWRAWFSHDEDDEDDHNDGHDEHDPDNGDNDDNEGNDEDETIMTQTWTPVSTTYIDKQIYIYIYSIINKEMID